MSVHVSKHPLVLAKLGPLRAVETKPPEFRSLVRGLATLLAQEATADLATKPAEVITPLGVAKTRELADRIVLVPILRAGLGMADAVLEMIPEAEVCHVGLRRDEHTLRPEEYYNKLPKRFEQAVVLVLDPMLATGGSAIHACRLLKEAGAARVKFLALIAAPEGVKALSSELPDVSIHVGVVDDKLNDVGFIFPGLGDAGDRQFATFDR